jgi:hypothetical protein
MPIITLMSLLGSEPMTTTVPVPQLLLGFMGLGSMVAYAIRRQMVTRDKQTKTRPVLLLARSLLQWLGGDHVAAHARFRTK